MNIQTELQAQYGKQIKKSLRQLAEEKVKEIYEGKVNLFKFGVALWNNAVCNVMKDFLDSDLIENEDIIEYIALRCVGTRDGLSLAVMGRYSEWMLAKFGLDNKYEIWRDELLAKMVEINKEV